MSSPVVSVVLLVHNGGAHLRPAVESILRQSMRDWDLTVWDNASTDGAVEFLRTCDDPRVRLIAAPENVGIPHATQAALDQVRGRYVILADHDDVQAAGRFDRQVTALEAQPAWAAVACAATTIDDGGRRTGSEFALYRAEDFQRYTAWSTGVVSPAFCYRREALAAVRRREAFRFASDYDVIARLAEGGAIAGLPEPLLAYRRHARQATRRHRITITAEECVVRLLTARRRAGRDEAAGPWLDWLQGPGRDMPDEAAVYQLFGDTCRAEGFPALAALLGRQHGRVRRGLARGSALATALGRALTASGGRGAALRALFLGPVRYHRVCPVR